MFGIVKCLHKYQFSLGVHHRKLEAFSVDVNPTPVITVTIQKFRKFQPRYSYKM